MIVVSPVAIAVAVVALSPQSPSVSGKIVYGVWRLEFLMLMVATFIYPPPRSNFATKKVLRLSDVAAFGPISTSRTVPTIVLVLLFAL